MMKEYKWKELQINIEEGKQERPGKGEGEWADWERQEMREEARPLSQRVETFKTFVFAKSIGSLQKCHMPFAISEKWEKRQDS